MKYRVKGMIVTYKGKDYKPGEIIELDMNVKHPFLEPVVEKQKAKKFEEVKEPEKEGESDDKSRGSQGNSKRSRK